jgi:hypothetical protein
MQSSRPHVKILIFTDSWVQAGQTTARKNGYACTAARENELCSSAVVRWMGRGGRHANVGLYLRIEFYPVLEKSYFRFRD